MLPSRISSGPALADNAATAPVAVSSDGSAVSGNAVGTPVTVLTSAPPTASGTSASALVLGTP
jgi:hypothetical protein